MPPDGILPGAKFTLRPSHALSCTGSVTARHSSSGRQPNFAAWYKEWNYRTVADGGTYIQLGGHHIALQQARHSFKTAPSHGSICTPSNTWFWAHITQHPKQHLDQFSHFCTVDDRRPILYNGLTFPLKIVPSHMGSGPHLTHGSLGPLSPHTKRNLDRFSGFCRAHDHETDRVTDRPTTDHDALSVIIGCTYIPNTGIQPNNSSLITPNLLYLSFSFSSSSSSRKLSASRE